MSLAKEALEKGMKEVNEEELPCFDAGFFAMVAAVAFLLLLHNMH